MNEKDYDRGNRAAWLSMLRECLRELGLDDTVIPQAALVVEREEAVAMLRMTCDARGDNDWPNDLNLADVIEKHLLNHLDTEIFGYVAVYPDGHGLFTKSPSAIEGGPKYEWIPVTLA